ncbi:MAG TPA: SelB C-terminal domain-containing protein, partial [Pyrinomonadaceae bacterium]|nr:SelB C-terminal domain-containing protein [Pyrinomonadaceae bacterium]
ERGMVLAPVGRLRPTQSFDALVQVLADAPRGLRTRQRVRVHHGTAEVLARVAVLEASGEVEPGSEGFVQLRLESPVVALPGDRFIIRSYSPQQTIAGGEVLDVHAPKHRGRERSVVGKRLAALVGADTSARLVLFVESAGERGMPRAEAAARTGWRDEVLDAALAEGVKYSMIVESEGVFIGSEIFGRLVRAAEAEVEAHHKREPLSRGLARETLRERVFTHVAPEIFRAVLKEAEVEGALVSEREVVRASGHSLRLSPADERLRERLEQVYRDAALEAPTLEEAFARAAPERGQGREHLRKILQLVIEAGALVRVREDLFFHREAIERLASSLKDYGARHEPERLIDVAAFKELSGVSRKYAIPLLEYFDRERVTRRAGDKRIIL